VSHVDPRHHLEQLARDMLPGPGASRRHVDLARVGFGIGDELGNTPGRERRIDLHDEGRAGEACYRRNIADEIEIELFVERRVDKVWRTDHQERIAVRRRTHDRLGANIAAATRPVFNDEWLAEPFRQPLTQQARIDV
jgi:hypothetical protein